MELSIILLTAFFHQICVFETKDPRFWCTSTVTLASIGKSYRSTSSHPKTVLDVKNASELTELSIIFLTAFFSVIKGPLIWLRIPTSKKKIQYEKTLIYEMLFHVY
jgi:hypothetical protein